MLARLVPGGALVTGAMSGAFTGYQVAGAKGAAAGAAAGVVSGFGALVASGMVIGAIGLPLTWPVLIPALLVSGVASSLGARWFTRLMFAGDQVKKFRESFREAVLTQLEQDSTTRVEQVEKAVDEQVSSAFAALRKRAREELGGLVEETQRTLDDLRERRTQAATRTEQELADLEARAVEVVEIESRLRTLAAGVRAMETNQEP
jgi:hypothetical protein